MYAEIWTLEIENGDEHAMIVLDILADFGGLLGNVQCSLV